MGLGAQRGLKLTPTPSARVDQVGESRPRLVVVDELRVGATLDPYLSLTALASYSSMSVRWLRDRLEDPGHPLPHYRFGGKITVRRSEYDAWALTYRRAGREDVAKIVDDVFRDLREQTP